MLSKWLASQVRYPSIYKFTVIDIAELIVTTDEIIDYLALELVLAHGNPQKIKDQYESLLRDAEDTNLDILKKYLEERILPGQKRISTRVGNFGEVLVATFLIEFEDFWFPIYKLRFREKKDWSMRLTDLCLIKQLEGSRILACYGEVKTVSGERNLKIAVKGHDSLVSGDVLADPEILHFTSTILYEANRLDEGRLISEIELGIVEYDKRHDLFIVHTKENWVDEILDELQAHPLDQRLVDFSVKVFLISHLREVIDMAYDRCAVVTKALIETMDKQAFFLNTYRRLGTLINDRKFQRELAQVQARSIQEELLTEQPDIRFTFDAKDVWRKCDYIFSNSSLLLREKAEGTNTSQEGPIQRKTLLGYLKAVAESFEYLSKFAHEEEKEILLINSAICYHVAGYHANAQCVTKLVETNYLSGIQESALENLDARLTLFFRLALISFLRREIAKLHHITQDAISFVASIQGQLLSATEETVIPEITNVYGHLFFQKALSNFAQYCMNGSPELLALAHKNIQQSHSYFQEVRDVRFGIVVSELRTLFSLFNEQSTWSNVARYGEGLIENPIWRTYLRNLAYEKSIVEFWSSQLKALQSGLLTVNDSFVIQMPTSTGKTFIAELAMLASLTKTLQKRCLYIAPYRALVNEVEDKLAGTFGSVGYRVSNLAGGFEFDSFQNFLAVESDILVATPEKIDLFFRTHPEYFENISTVVIDEGHMLDEGIPSQNEQDARKTTLSDELERSGTLGRGVSLEMLVTRLKRKLPQAHFLFLSAVMPEVNVDDFVAWLSRSRQAPLKVDRNERPSRQMIASFQWRRGAEEKGGYNGELQYFNPDGTITFVPYFLQKSQYYTGELTPTKRLERKTWPSNINTKVQGTALLASRFAKTGPVLVFCAMISQVKQVVENVITSLKLLEASGKAPSDHLKYVQTPDLESFELAQEWLGEDHPLTGGLHYGVGLHYRPLPDPVRQAVEDDYRDGKIQILVCTNTLGQGVNMPVKTAIIHSLERAYYDQEEEERKTSKVKKRDFWNICGRAGRAGKETAGQIIFVSYSSDDSKLLEEYKDEANLETVESPLFKLLEALIEERITQDELLGYLDPYVLALLAEEVVDTQDERAISDFLKTSLVGVQALRTGLNLEPLASIIRRTAIGINNEVPDKTLQRVFSSTGLQVNSCKIIAQAVDLFLKTLPREVLETESENLYLNERLLEHALKACQDIPEMKLARDVDTHGLQDEFKFIKDWVAGKSIGELRSEYWPLDKEDDFGEYIGDRIIYKLPWGFNGFLRILAFKLQKKYEDLPMAWQYLPSMMKLGVNSVVACWVGSFGVSSRKLILELASLYLAKNNTSSLDFLKWIVNLPTEFIFQEVAAGSVAEKKRLVKRINQTISDDSHLNFISRKQRVLNSSVQGIAYNNRKLVALKVRQDDQLQLEAEPDNPYDPCAVRVLFDGEQIGYVQRDTARIISKELQMGRTFQAYAKTVRPPILNYPYPHIEMTIIG